MGHQKHIGDLFAQEPPQWGLRGDPYLWRDLRSHFADVPLPESMRVLEQEIEKAFGLLTGHTLSAGDDFFVARYAHGGMSSGHVCAAFWLEQALPLLKSRFTETA